MRQSILYLLAVIGAALVLLLFAVNSAFAGEPTTKNPWDWLYIFSAIVTLVAFFLLSVGEIQRYLWRNVVKRNLRWLWQVTCRPQFFDLTIKGRGKGGGIKYRFCRCPPGTFKMGSPVNERGHQEDERQHTVELSRVFWIGETPVTNELWAEIMRSPEEEMLDEEKKKHIEASREMPVMGRSWYECQIFVKKLNEILDGEAPEMNVDDTHDKKFTEWLERNRFTTWFQSNNQWRWRLVLVPPMGLWFVALVTYFWWSYLGVGLAAVALLLSIVLFISTCSRIRWLLSLGAHIFLQGIVKYLQKCPPVSQFLPAINEFPKGFRFALPSEAQWEYACRAQWSILFQQPTAYSHGNSIDAEDCPKPYLDQYAHYAGDNSADVEIKKVSKHGDAGNGKLSNAWGIYDMHGNVWEWVNDWYGDYPEDNVDRAVVDPTGPVTGERSRITGEKAKERVLRGGSCQRTAYGCRSARRQQREPIWEHPRLGFRLVLVHEDNPSNPKVIRLSSPPIRFYYGDNQDIEFNFRKCPAGAFRMGSKDWQTHTDSHGHKDREDERRHVVAFSQDFYIGETTVTIKQWNAIMPDEQRRQVSVDPKQKKEEEKLPVTNVSWFDCMEWVRLANEAIANASKAGTKSTDKKIVLPKEYKNYRFAIPTEAQWEYACRADKDRNDFWRVFTYR